MKKTILLAKEDLVSSSSSHLTNLIAVAEVVLAEIYGPIQRGRGIQAVSGALRSVSQYGHDTGHLLVSPRPPPSPHRPPVSRAASRVKCFKIMTVFCGIPPLF